MSVSMCVYLLISTTIKSIYLIVFYVQDANELKSLFIIVLCTFFYKTFLFLVLFYILRKQLNKTAMHSIYFPITTVVVVERSKNTFTLIFVPQIFLYRNEKILKSIDLVV